MHKYKIAALSAIAVVVIASLAGCSKPSTETQENPYGQSPVTGQSPLIVDQSRLDIYYPVELSADLSSYSPNQRKMLSVLIDASKIMDDLFWKQAFGQDKSGFLESIDDPKISAFADINYGPWDRLNGNTAFLSGVEEKSKRRTVFIQLI